MKPSPCFSFRFFSIVAAALLPLSSPATEAASAAPAEWAQVAREKISPSPPTLSPRLVALIAAGLPPYVPPSAASDNAGAGEESNGDDSILHLPNYVVRGPRMPVVGQGDVLTRKGLTEIVEKRYLTDLDRVLNIVRIALLAPTMQGRALVMYDEDERLRKMADLDLSVRQALLVDPVGGADLKRLADATYQRTSDFGRSEQSVIAAHRLRFSP